MFNKNKTVSVAKSNAGDQKGGEERGGGFGEKAYRWKALVEGQEVITLSFCTKVAKASKSSDDVRTHVLNGRQKKQRQGARGLMNSSTEL